MRQIHFLEEHDQRTLIRETRRGAKGQLAFGLLLLAGFATSQFIDAETLNPLTSLWGGLLGLAYISALLCGAGLVIGGIVEIIWVRRLEAKLNRELS